MSLHRKKRSSEIGISDKSLLFIKRFLFLLSKVFYFIVKLDIFNRDPFPSDPQKAGETLI